jgi:Uma2 family endonuclease
MTSKLRGISAVTVLHGVRYKDYVKLVMRPENYHLRMAYHDGTLEIVSPLLRKHEKPSDRLRIVITTVADRLGLTYDGTGSYTYRRAGDGPRRGKGKEPDQSFYFANTGRVPMDRDPDLDAGDPPPDLWIEVDNRVSSAGRLPIYAALGVPEVWRYRAKSKTLKFLRLVGDSYESIDQSLSLPVLTPTLVLEALELGGDVPESSWIRLLREWAERNFPPQAIDGRDQAGNGFPSQ